MLPCNKNTPGHSHAISVPNRDVGSRSSLLAAAVMFCQPEVYKGNPGSGMAWLGIRYRCYNHNLLLRVIARVQGLIAVWPNHRHSDLAIPRRWFGHTSPVWFGHTTINPWTSAITLLLYTCYFTFRTLCVILSRILHKKQPFQHGIAQNVFLFMPVGHIATAGTLVTQPKQTVELCKHDAQAPLPLAENLGRVRMQYAKFKVQYENLLHDRFSGKV